MRAKRGAGGEVALAGTAEEVQRSASIAEPEHSRKQASLGKCVCGAEIGAVHTMGCKTCSAWARWRSAFRIAANALRGPQ